MTSHSLILKQTFDLMCECCSFRKVQQRMAREIVGTGTNQLKILSFGTMCLFSFEDKCRGKYVPCTRISCQVKVSVYTSELQQLNLSKQ